MGALRGGAAARQRHGARAAQHRAGDRRGVDFLAWELRPDALDDLGLAAALAAVPQEWSAHHGMPQNSSDGARRRRLAPEAETTFYRVAQEALNNVAKHAHASRVDVILERRDGEVVLVIEDDGVGFDPAETDTAGPGMGLAGMRERAALVGAHAAGRIDAGQGHDGVRAVPVAASAGAPMSEPVQRLRVAARRRSRDCPPGR